MTDVARLTAILEALANPVTSQFIEMVAMRPRSAKELQQTFDLPLSQVHLRRRAEAIQDVSPRLYRLLPCSPTRNRSTWPSTRSTSSGADGNIRTFPDSVFVQAGDELRLHQLVGRLVHEPSWKQDTFQWFPMADASMRDRIVKALRFLASEREVLSAVAQPRRRREPPSTTVAFYAGF